MKTVIMAGGFGTRLYPLTRDVPKPMLAVGEQPLLQRIVNQLKDAGILDIHLSVFHFADQIREYFGDGSEFGVKIKYLQEDEPLGTAGALSLVEDPKELLLVLNGDILTSINFRHMIAYHSEQCADMTMAVHPYSVQIPYGVVECEDLQLRAMREKPREKFWVNAGIYLLEASVQQRIPVGQPYNMSELINDLLESQRRVACYQFEEYWLDIGQHSQYKQAQDDVKNLC